VQEIVFCTIKTNRPCRKPDYRVGENKTKIMKKIFTLLFAAALTANCAHAQNWLTTGNSGLTAANFLGTTDAIPLNLKVNNKQAGKIDYASAKANTSFGFQTLKSNTGAGNSAFGFQVMASNTTGFANTAAGQYSMQKNINGNSNTAYGSQALQNNKSGYFNTAIGQASLPGSKGNDNTAVGRYALISLTTGSGNTAIGSAANVSDSALSNVTLLGFYTVGTASNQVRIGNDQVTSIGGFADWTNISDGRVKKNIKTNVPGLAFINKLKPVTYNLNLDAADKIIQKQVVKTPDGKTKQPSPEELTARKQKEQIIYTGFIAQDVEKAAKELNYDFSGVDAAKNDKDLYGIRYAEFVVPLVKAVQELSKLNDEKDEKINALEERLEKLENLSAVQSPVSSSKINPTGITINGASLEQNMPNPFTNTTKINYTLPQKFTTAQILITDKNGKLLKQQSISGGSKGTINVDASTLVAGAYNYSLIVDGRVISSRQMVLTK